MNRTLKKSSYSLDLRMYCSDSLLSSNGIETLWEILEDELPEWSLGVHFWLDFAGKIPLKGDFVREVRDFALRTGSLYPKADQVKQRMEGERRFGSAELHGSEASMLAIVTLDDLRFAPSGGRYRCANVISLQFRQPKCVGRPVELLAPRILYRFAESSSLLFAHARLTTEWNAKNMCFDTGAMAIGIDISRYLPGLYWLNYFGATHTQMLGKERLLSAPAFSTAEISDGVLVQVDEMPESWNATTSRHASVLRHIGEQYFFSRDDPTRTAVAPDFGLPKLKRFERLT